MGALRFRVVPRDVSAAAVARVLGLTEARFTACLPDLIARKFPPPDPTTGNFDLKAVSDWQDSRSGIRGAAEAVAKDAATVVAGRIEAIRRG